MSDDPISVPVPEQTDEQKAAQEADFQKSDILNEVLGQLKPQAAQVLQTAQGLGHDASKDDLSALADSIDQLAQAARNGQGRLDGADLPTTSASYHAIHNLSDYCDVAHKDAQQAAGAAGDNDEVKATAIQNMQQSLDSGISALQQV
jgi:hypothetical protein